MNKTAAAVIDAGGRADAHHLDISRTDDRQSVTAADNGWARKTDGLCKVPASSLAARTLRLTSANSSGSGSITVNLNGTQLGMRVLLPSMIANGGGRMGASD
jgi:hypothetical protein